MQQYSHYSYRAQILSLIAYLAVLLPTAAWAQDPETDPRGAIPRSAPNSASSDSLRPLWDKSQRIVFLGDSITYAGHYVSYLESWMLTQESDSPPLIIDMGLPSETVSGLSEDGHAGGAFPRPVLRERLGRVLAVTRPDLVFACYGMNCAIYQPWDEQRFERYQQGIRELRSTVTQAGAQLILMTPPAYDDQQGKLEFSYNDVLKRYAQWLLSQRQQGWWVIDLHGPMTRELQRRRVAQSGFSFQPDAVHPNQEGHWLIAAQIINALGDQDAARCASPAEMLSSRDTTSDVMPMLEQRMQLLRDAYLTAAGHTRPGIPEGLSVPDAEAEAERLRQEIVAQVQRR